MSNLGDFLKYMLKGTVDEIKSFFIELLSLRPRTIVYITGGAFFLAWLFGQVKTAFILLLCLILALLYKYWIGGEWKHEARKRRIEEARKKYLEQNPIEKEGDAEKDPLTSNTSKDLGSSLSSKNNER